MEERHILLAIRLVDSPKDPEAINDAMREICAGHGEELFIAIMDELSTRKDQTFRLPLIALDLFREMATISAGVAGYFFGRVQTYELYDHETFDSVAAQIFDYDSYEYVRSLMRLGAETSDLGLQRYYLMEATAMRKRLDAAAEKAKKQARRAGRSS